MRFPVWREMVIGVAGSYASSDADTFGGNLDIDSYQMAGYGRWQQNAIYLNAAIGFGYHDTDSSRAGTANLSVNDEDEDSFRTKLGLRLSHDITTQKGTRITPSASIAYVREMMDNVSRMEAGFSAVPTTTFQINGTELDRDRLQIGLGVTGQLNENTTLNVAYNGEFAGSDDNHNFSATVHYTW